MNLTELQHFCATFADTRIHLYHPWKQRGYAVASDGVCIVFARVPNDRLDKLDRQHHDGARRTSDRILQRLTAAKDNKRMVPLMAVEKSAGTIGRNTVRRAAVGMMVFDASRLLQLKTLPGLRVCTDYADQAPDRHMLLFTFDAGCGALMPLESAEPPPMHISV